MLRPSPVRSVMLLSTLLLTLASAACSSEGERAPNNNAASGAPVAAANQSGSNTATVNSNAVTGNTAAAQAKLNLNTASEQEFLDGVPGLGKRMAHEFEEYRPYRSVQQFRREMGKYVSPAQIVEYEKYVYVPVAENESDAATLQQLPGLDAAEADALIAGRPYASRDAFLAKLSEKVSAADLAVARTYLDSK